MHWQLFFVASFALVFNRSQAAFSRTQKAELRYHFIFPLKGVLICLKFNWFFNRDEARDMFYHAYNAYMENAFPADELMPLSCRGRVRGVEPDRGDIDDALGK